MIWLQIALSGSIFSCTYTEHVEYTGWMSIRRVDANIQNKDTSEHKHLAYASAISTSPCVAGSPSISTSNCSAADRIVAIFCLKIFIDSGRSFSGA